MDAKVTLSFNASIIEKAKDYAESQGLSLSRLTEILLKKVITTGQQHNIEEIPIADWVHVVAKGEAEYQTQKTASKKLKKEFYESRK